MMKRINLLWFLCVVAGISAGCSATKPLSVDIADGNTLRWSSYNSQPQFITTWHAGAGENPESIYEWTGKVFKQIK